MTEPQNGDSDTCHTMDEPRGHAAQGTLPGSGGHMLCGPAHESPEESDA